MKLWALLLAATIMPGESQLSHSSKPLRYAAVGDSYSIGEGASEEQSWPALLARRLTKSGIPVTLVSNPSRTGWTTKDAITHELPAFHAARPDFGTLMLGVNDWAQGVDEKTFRTNLAHLMDEMLKALPNDKRLLVINIPDFSVTPDGPTYARGREISAGLTKFNHIIEEEAGKRGVRVVDIFPLSQQMGKDRSLVAADGLHPSAKAYSQWGELIFPVARELLGK